MPEPANRDDMHRRIQRIRAVRWGLVVLSAVLAVALIVHGDVLIGALVAVIAVARGWSIVMMTRHLDEMRGRRQQRIGRSQGGGGAG